MLPCFSPMRTMRENSPKFAPLQPPRGKKKKSRATNVKSFLVVYCVLSAGVLLTPDKPRIQRGSTQQET